MRKQLKVKGATEAKTERGEEKVRGGRRRSFDVAKWKYDSSKRERGRKDEEDL